MKKMKRVLILGGTGRSGQAIIKELVQVAELEIIVAFRQVTDTQRLPITTPTLATSLIDYDHLEDSAALFNDADVIINALRLREDHPDFIVPENSLVAFDQALRHLLINPKTTIISIGGAGALNRSPHEKVWQDLSFPSKTLPRGRAQAQLRSYLEKLNHDAHWSYLIPPLHYVPDGVRTGAYETFAPAQKEGVFAPNRISYADFGIAIKDAVLEDWQGVYLISN